MKSYLFNGLKRDGQLEDFVAGLSVFEHLSDDDVAFLVESYISTKKTTSGPRIKSINDQIVARFSHDLNLAEMAMNSISLLSQGISFDHARDGESGFILQDVSDYIGEDQDRERINAVLVNIVSALAGSKAEVDSEIRKLRAAQGVFPRVIAVGQTIELRAVLAEDPNTPINETDVESYQPRFVELIPIASIGIRTDTEETYLFQIDEEALGLFVNVLGIIQKQFVEMKKLAALTGVK